MIAAASLLVVLLLSLIVVRVASVALTLTGVPRAVAAFQARSAWTATGFTTAESNTLMTHPVRRQIISLLMLLRGAGLVTAASTLMLSFVNSDRGQGLRTFALLVAGLLLLWMLARSRWVDRWMSRIIAAALKRYTDIETRDYAALLHLAGEYAIMELEVRSRAWLAGRRLDSLRLADEGILALGVSHPDGHYTGAPRGDTEIGARDVLVLYGRSPALAELGRRRSGSRGDAAHRTAVAEEKKHEAGSEM